MKASRIPKIEEEVETEGTWAISYGDMITLLLCFFVIFFTTDFDKKKNDKMNQQVVAEILDLNLGLAKSGINTHHKEQKKTANLEEFSGILPEVEVIPWENNLIVKFSNISFFDSGKVDLTDEGQKTLKQFVEKYIHYAGNYKLSVKAFTDRRKVRQVSGRFKDNLELSALRAVAAMRELKANGIPITKIDIAGYGEMVKIQNYLMNIENLNEQQRNALSRTIVMIIKPEKEESFL